MKVQLCRTGFAAMLRLSHDLAAEFHRRPMRYALLKGMAKKGSFATAEFCHENLDLCVVFCNLTRTVYVYPYSKWCWSWGIWIYECFLDSQDTCGGVFFKELTSAMGTSAFLAHFWQSCAECPKFGCFMPAMGTCHCQTMAGKILCLSWHVVYLNYHQLVGGDWNMTFIFSRITWELPCVPIYHLICQRVM